MSKKKTTTKKAQPKPPPPPEIPPGQKFFDHMAPFLDQEMAAFLTSDLIKPELVFLGQIIKNMQQPKVEPMQMAFDRSGAIHILKDNTIFKVNIDEDGERFLQKIEIPPGKVEPLNEPPVWCQLCERPNAECLCEVKP